MSEIKLLFCVHTGCTSPKTVHPEIALCSLPIYRNDKLLNKRAHTGCTPSKIVHPAVKMCTPGAGCTLNFGHCNCITVFKCNFYLWKVKNIDTFFLNARLLVVIFAVHWTGNIPVVVPWSGLSARRRSLTRTCYIQGPDRSRSGCQREVGREAEIFNP